MDKSWIGLPNRLCREYIDGVASFIEVAKQHLDDEGKTRCPCRNCLNAYWKPIEVAHKHIYRYGFSRLYVNWVFHGEEYVAPKSNAGPNTSSIGQQEREDIDDCYDDDMLDILNDVYQSYDDNDDMENIEPHTFNEEIRNDNNGFNNLFVEAGRKLYRGCKQSTPPLGLKEADWHYLCDFFGTNEKYMHRSQVNKKNRENVPYSRYAGSKPFVYHLHERSKHLPERQTQGRVDFFHDMHYHDKKGWINETAQQRYEDMSQRRSQLLDEGLEIVNEDAIADEVLGTRSGYISSMGFGPKPASYSRKRKSSPDLVALRERILSLEEEYDSYRQQNEEQISSLKEECASYKRKTEEWMSKYEEDMSQMREFIRQFMAQHLCSSTSSSRFCFPPPSPPPPSATS